jgi:formate dehydrogenase gamma subunit
MSKEIPQRYLRFPLVRRIEHWVNAISFIVLAVTGIPQKYATTAWAQAMIRAMGGIEFIRIIHRVSAVILAFAAIWHVGYAIWHWYVKRGPLSMLPSKDDATNAWKTVRYNIGVSNDHPKQGFYTFEEKIEYWALVWGTLVMVVTGFFLWNPITAARFLPGQFIPAAKAAHSGEALLAVLSILVWHLYHVFVKTFNRSMYTGYMTREQMEHEHPLAMEQAPPIKVEPSVFAKRKSRFWAGYGAVATIWLVGVFWFVTSEQTALDVVPTPESVPAFVAPTPIPQAERPPLSARAVALGSTWEDGIGNVFVSRCGECHQPVVEVGNLDLNTYQGALVGGDAGPAIIPNAPGASLVLIWPNLDDHPGKLSSAEREAVFAWIENGAPE